MFSKAADYQAKFLIAHHIWQFSVSLGKQHWSLIEKSQSYCKTIKSFYGLFLSQMYKGSPIFLHWQILTPVSILIEGGAKKFFSNGSLSNLWLPLRSRPTLRHRNRICPFRPSLRFLDHYRHRMEDSRKGGYKECSLQTINHIRLRNFLRVLLVKYNLEYRL